MKKTLTITLICLTVLLIPALVLAQGGVRDTTGEYHDEVVAAGGLEGIGSPNPELLQEAKQIRAGNYATIDGRQMQLTEKANNRLELKVGNAMAETGLQIRQEANGEMQTQLSNGRNALIKVMPDTASETALARLRLRSCNETNNCTIELKEVGQGDQTRLAYEMQTQRDSRVFGLFRAQMNVQTQVDAETGEVIQTNKPWWAFLATEPAEE